MSDAAFFRRWWCFFTHSRFGIWNESGDIVCQKCDRIVWKAASTSAEYRRTYGR